MTVEQAALASQMIQSWVVLTSLASRVAQVQVVLASRVAQQQTALASLMDLVA